MKIKKTLIASVLAVALLGCGKQQTRHIVILLDISGSIDQESLEQAFKAMDDLASHLQRGDRLTIIPILGDAEAEASGKILRFEVPANRQAYDTDMRDFRSKLTSSLQMMEANAVTRPGSKTDILGSIALAEQEFESVLDKSPRLLFILSDFIQEDRELNFRKDRRLTNQVTSRKFATEIVKTHTLDLRGTRVYLGLLRSNEYSRLNSKRRTAIQEFWIEYTKSLGGLPKSAMDGLELIQSSLNR